jgi:D-tyrosyl-tRNA(Tyr) deacylase
MAVCHGVRILSFSGTKDYHAAMIAVVQRVSEAKVTVQGAVAGKTGRGLLVLLCAVRGDVDGDVAYLVKKISQLRIFEDGNGKMNLSIRDIGGAALVVSQFTLAADTRSGNRPSFVGAEMPERARVLRGRFAAGLRHAGIGVETGVFGEMMEVSLVNEGPVTIILDSRTGRQP